jgi:hypothetical protein
LRGRAVAPPEHVAYEVFLAHRRSCAQCCRSLFLCGEGDRLWVAFKVAIPPARVPAWLTA